LVAGVLQHNRHYVAVALPAKEFVYKVYRYQPAKQRKIQAFSIFVLKRLSFAVSR
jgi:hypothetical protein